MAPFNPIETAFKGRRLNRQVIILCVGWYTSFKLMAPDRTDLPGVEGRRPEIDHDLETAS
jgi:hypothetical protein